MNLSLLSSILRKPWFIDQQSAYSYLPVVNSLLGISPMDAFTPYPKDHLQSLAANHKQVKPLNHLSDIAGIQQGSIALIPVRGPLVKDDVPCGDAGMNTLTEMIQMVDNTPGFIASILYVDSPGGTVDGTETLANAILNSQKPVVAFVDGMMASAALWIGSAADYIIANSPFDQVGSVGVIMSIVDMRPAYEKMGVRFHDVVSSQTPDKIKTFQEILSGKYENLQKEVLNPLADHFISQVKAHLPQVSDDYLSGSLYFAKDALGTFIHEIATFDRAVSKAMELSQGAFEKSISVKDQKSQGMNTQFPILLSLLGLEGLESTYEGIYLSTDQLSQLEDYLKTTQHLESVNKELSLNLDRLSKDYRQLSSTVESLSEKVAQLADLPGEEPALAVSSTDNPAKAQKKDDDFAAQFRSALEFWNTVN